VSREALNPTGRPELYYSKALHSARERTVKPLVLKLHPSDNVAVAPFSLPAGTDVTVDGRSISLCEAVPAGHKIALAELSVGTQVVKYGHSIGEITQPVRRGEWVHTHNLKTSLSGVIKYQYKPTVWSSDSEPTGCAFNGYLRANGDVGTRNEVWILPTVGCVNHAAERIVRACSEQFVGRIDGVFSFAHPYGCSQSGHDLDNTQRILAGLMRHPNAGGVLLLGLGCEDNQIESQLEAAGEFDRSRLRYFNAQDIDDEVERGVEAVRELVSLMEHDSRTERPVSDLIIGLECGGSDALSGITANPLVGRVADRVVAEGGGSILSEVSEMFGAEQTLMSRAVNEDVFSNIEGLINDFKQYFIALGRPIYENPSPGNLEGGLTTLEEKSLGAIKKGGSAPVAEVLRYGDTKRAAGLSLLETPGNDGVSTTGMVAAGATAILFTTGRGTPLGSPVPIVKISTNTSLYERKPGWIDFNAGALADGSAEMGALESGLFDLLLDVASGRTQANNERSDYRDIAIWKTGVTH
jgi:altronate hydrolase